MSDTAGAAVAPWWQSPIRWLSARFAQREQQVLRSVSIMIGALTGLAVVALLLLTERPGARLYPVGSPAWRRIVTPVIGSLTMGWVLLRYFPNARGSGITQTKVALNGRTVLHRALANGEGARPLKELAAGAPLPHLNSFGVNLADADNPLNLKRGKAVRAKLASPHPPHR